MIKCFIDGYEYIHRYFRANNSNDYCIPNLITSFHLIIPVMKFNEWTPLQGSPFTKSQNKYDKRKKSC
jgi:hypothetical protein